LCLKKLVALFFHALSSSNCTISTYIVHVCMLYVSYSILFIQFFFRLTSIYLDVVSRPVCTKFFITITLQNNEHSGSIPVIMDVKPKLSPCKDNLYPGDVDLLKNSESEFVPLDIVVIVVVVLSSLTYIRSLIKSSLLAKVCVYACVLCKCMCAAMYVCL